MNQKRAKAIRKIVPMWRNRSYTDTPVNKLVPITLEDGKTAMQMQQVSSIRKLEEHCGRNIYQAAKQIEKVSINKSKNKG